MLTTDCNTNSYSSNHIINSSKPVNIPEKNKYSEYSKIEYSLHFNNFNPSKMSPSDIWKIRLEQRINDITTNK